MSTSRDVSPISVAARDFGLEGLNLSFELESLQVIDTHDNTNSTPAFPSSQATHQPSLRGRRSPSPVDVSMPSKPLLQTNGGNRTRSATIACIHWLHPTIMAVALTLGFPIAIGHHMYYRWLNGQVVGSTENQQWALRIGNGFAITVGFLLRTAVGISYIQRLWMSLGQTSVSLQTINDAFSAPETVLSLWNWELISKIKIGVLIAAVFWSLPVGTIIAPVTLSVTGSMSTISSHVKVPTIGISNSSLLQNFVSYPDQPGQSQPSRSSTRFSRIIDSVAFSGQRLSFQSPATQGNASYQIQSYAPLLKCGPANSTVQSTLITMLMDVSQDLNSLPGIKNGILDGGKLMPDSFDNQTFHWINSAFPREDSEGSNSSLYYGDVGYFGVVPVWDRNGRYHMKLSPWWNATQMSTDEWVAYKSLGYLDGEIWIAIPTNSPALTNQTEMEFINCRLYNSSLTINIEFINHALNMTVVDEHWINDVRNNNSLYNIDHDITSYNPAIYNTDHSSYFAYFQEIGSYLIGSKSWWNSSGNAYVRDATDLLHTHLATSSQVYNMDQKIQHAAGMDYPNSSEDQIRNATFALDIEAFALNSTLSILSDKTLCNFIMADVNTTLNKTVYLYESKNLVIVYSCMLIASTIAVVIGAFSFHTNGASYDASVSTFAIAMQNPEINKVLSGHTNSIQPLDKSLGKVKLRFAGAEGFVKGKS